MARDGSTIALEADPNDPDDFDVSVEGVEKALAERRARMGRPRGSNKTQVALRLDNDVIERFKADGPGWQSRMNAALRAAVMSNG